MFCLAADYLLARAHEADFVEGKSRAAQHRAMNELHQEISADFIAPMAEAKTARAAQARAQKESRPQAALAGEALAA